MIEYLGEVSRSSHDRPRDPRRYVPETIRNHLRELTGEEVVFQTRTNGSKDGIKVHLLPKKIEGCLVIDISEAGQWHTFTIKTADPEKFGKEFHEWCRSTIRHAQIIWK